MYICGVSFKVPFMFYVVYLRPAYCTEQMHAHFPNVSIFVHGLVYDLLYIEQQTRHKMQGTKNTKEGFICISSSYVRYSTLLQT
jgi:hypothetical protein